MKILELHINGRMSRNVDELGPKIGSVDLWRIMETVSGLAVDKDILLTLTVEEVEESAPSIASMPQHGALEELGE